MELLGELEQNEKELYADLNWLVQEFECEGISAQIESDGQKQFILLDVDSQPIRLEIMTMLHKRNGEHIVLQMHLA